MKVRARDIAMKALNVHTFAVASLGNVKSSEAAHKPIGARTTQIHTKSVVSSTFLILYQLDNLARDHPNNLG